MVSNRKIGDAGEDIARQYLIKSGYEILDTNWYHGHLEIDIVAREDTELVITEVKSRNGNHYEHPSEAITKNKIKRIVNAAEAYIFEKNINIETRFDVITVIFLGDSFELEHFKNAFYPTI